MDLTSLSAAAWRWKVPKDEDEHVYVSPEVDRLRAMLSSGQLLHPFLSQDGSQTVPNFRDLAEACAICCGVSIDHSPSSHPCRHSSELAQLLGRTDRKHIVLILCDGMGNNVLDLHLKEKSSFLHRFNNPNKLRSVFPSTTPAALTTLATAQWPGRHGAPGWDLRHVEGCEFPGEPQDPVQLRVLAPKITNVRCGTPHTSSSLDDIFLAKPWARSIREQHQSSSSSSLRRQMVYINAYNGDDFPSWYQGESSDSTEFSSWQMGGERNPLFQATKIGETVSATLGVPEGSKAAIQYFAHGIDSAIAAIADAESKDQTSFIYLYTSHPDKHMHALGIEHAEVEAVVKGLNDQIERLWATLCDRKSLLKDHGNDINADDDSSALDAVVVVTADHGHISVKPDDMMKLPGTIIECLEYANIGLHGKGRHAYLHCKSGLQTILRERWRSNRKLHDNFLLLTIEEAAAHGLFGPDPPLFQTRPRLGDFVAVALNRTTLVTPNEFQNHSHHCQGAHGSLLPEEMQIPFVFLHP